MKKNLTLILLILFSANLQSFPQNFCRNNKMNSTAGELENYVYKEYVSEKGKEKQLHIGLVRPIDDLKIKKRPLIIGVHGGGFVDFCPFEPCYVKQSRNVLTPNFTPQGFITAAVQYRLTAPLDFKPPRIKDEKLKETHYKAVQDVREAIKYVFENAEKLGVDKENVFLFGSSAGAITALHAAFLDTEEAPRELVEKYGALAKKEKIKGVISFSGALYDLSYLKGGDKIPMLLVHGTQDGIVPIDKGFYLGMKHLTPVYGDRAIFEEARRQGIEAKGLFYDFGHDYPDRFLSDIFKNTNDFIRSNLTCAN